jgi:hypothetical protein
LRTKTLFLRPVIWAGPETEPQTKSDEEVELIVRLAKGLVAVLGTERSTTQLFRRWRLQGVCEWRDEDGRMICVFFWFVMEIEVAVVEREGRSFVVDDGSASAFSVVLWTSPVFDDVWSEEEDFSLGGVWT